jgi:hypothetical protein
MFHCTQRKVKCVLQTASRSMSANSADRVWHVLVGILCIRRAPRPAGFTPFMLAPPRSLLWSTRTSSEDTNIYKPETVRLQVFTASVDQLMFFLVGRCVSSVRTASMFRAIESIFRLVRPCNHTIPLPIALIGQTFYKFLT